MDVATEADKASAIGERNRLLFVDQHIITEAVDAVDADIDPAMRQWDETVLSAMNIYRDMVRKKAFGNHQPHPPLVDALFQWRGLVSDEQLDAMYSTDEHQALRQSFGSPVILVVESGYLAQDPTLSLLIASLHSHRRFNQGLIGGRVHLLVVDPRATSAAQAQQRLQHGLWHVDAAHQFNTALSVDRLDTYEGIGPIKPWVRATIPGNVSAGAEVARYLDELSTAGVPTVIHVGDSADSTTAFADELFAACQIAEQPLPRLLSSTPEQSIADSARLKPTDPATPMRVTLVGPTIAALLEVAAQPASEEDAADVPDTRENVALQRVDDSKPHWSVAVPTTDITSQEMQEQLQRFQELAGEV